MSSHSHSHAHGDDSHSHAHGDDSHSHSHSHKHGGGPSYRDILMVAVPSISFFFLFEYDTLLERSIGFATWISALLFVGYIFVFNVPKREFNAFIQRYYVFNGVFFLIANFLQIGFAADIQQRTPFHGNYIVHVDLKGMPPRVEYLETFFREVREYGATGVLIEWEDTFPFSGELEDLSSSGTSYSKEDVKRIISSAQKNNLEVIPLVHTLSHLEYLLKDSKYENLREQSDVTSGICPTHPDALPLIQSIISQIIELHPNSSRIHLGMNDIWNFGKCSPDQTQRELYLSYISSLSKFCEKKKLQVMVWDEAFRKWEISELKELPKNLIPVILNRHSDVTLSSMLHPGEMYYRYRRSFTKIWAGSTFKGVKISLLPSLSYYLASQRSWNRLNKAQRMNFDGVILTGNQRTSHSGSFLELLPSSFPSLILSLQILKQGTDSLSSVPSTLERLGLKDLPLESPQMEKHASTTKGSFTGSNIFTLLSKVDIDKAKASGDESLSSLLEEALKEIYFEDDIQLYFASIFSED